MSATVRHWKRSFQCDHTANGQKGALSEALRCANVPDTGLHVLSLVLMDRGYVEYVVPGRDVHVFRIVRGKH